MSGEFSRMLDENNGRGEFSRMLDEDPFAQTKRGARQTRDDRIPVNQPTPWNWRRDAALAASSAVRGVAGIPDSVVQTPRNAINLGKAAAGGASMLVADMLRDYLGVGDGAPGLVGALDSIGLTDTPDNPIPGISSIPAYPVTSGIDAGLRAVTGTGLAQPETPGERIMDWTIQGAAGGAAMSPGSGIPGLMRGLLNKAHVPPTVLPIGIPAELNTLRNAVLSGAGTGWAGGLVSEATESPVLGSIASMGIIPAASAAARSAATSPRIIVTKKGRERNVGELLRQNIDTPESAVGLLRDADGPVFPASPESGAGATVGPTTGQVMAQNGDNRLIGIERALTQSPTPESNALVRRYKSNAEARQAEMERMNPIPAGGGADTVQRAVEREVRRQLALIEDTRQGRESAAIAERDAAIAAREPVKAAAASAAETARADAGDTISSEDAGAVMGAAYDAADYRERAAAGAEFQIDPFNEIHDLPVPMDTINSIIDEGYAGLSSEASAPVRRALRLIDKAVADNAKRKVGALEDGPAKPEAVKMRRNGIDTTVDDLATAISKYGGISREDALRNGIDPQEINARAAFGKPVFTKDGHPLDRMAELLHQDGYPVAYPDEGYSQNALLDALGEQMQGRRVYAPAGHEHQAAIDHYNEMLAGYDPKNDNSYLLFDENLRPVAGSDRFKLSYNQARVVDREIGDLQRSATPGTNEYRILGLLKDAVRKSFDMGVESGAIPAETADAYKQAVAGYRDYASRYKDGVMKGMRKDYGGNRRTRDKDIPDRMLRGGSEAFGSFQRAIGSEPGVAKTAQDWLATQWRKAINKPDGGLKSGWRDASAKFIVDHTDVLSQYPDLQRKLLSAVDRSKSAEDLASRIDAEIKAAEQAADSGIKSAAKRAKAGETAVTKETGARFFLRDADPEKAFAAFIKSGSRLVDGRFILQLSRRDPAFRRGVDAAIRDHIAGMKNDAERVRFIEAPANRRLLQSLFGSETLSNWDRVAKDARRDMLRDTANPARGSDTTPKAEALKKVAGDAVTSPLLTRIMSAINQSIGGRKRDELRAEALTDPKLAADLLEKANNRPGFVDLYKRSAGRAAAGNQDKRKGQ